MSKKLIPLLMLALPAIASAQKYKTCSLSQFKWDDSTDKKLVCIMHYNDEGRMTWKEYPNSQSVVDAEEDGDDKGTKVYYLYKDNLLLTEYRLRGPEYEDSVLSNYSYNAKGQLIQKVIRRHDKFTQTDDASGASVTSWKWLIDSTNYEYNSAGQLITQKGGDKWHRFSYGKSPGDTRDTAYSSPEDLKAKNYFVSRNVYTKDKQLAKKIKVHYVQGKKHFDHTITYAYDSSTHKLLNMHSVATSYSKSKADDAKLENMRFDKKFFYYKDGKLEREETWDPEGFRLLTTMYAYK
ncbi:MAG: hypothetical protein BGO69_09690 [Bacteroidetes bacterium 46-16]|nr:MAG: hypothetical protein BGO69_09690 [Bacteroidetes bacterium 46-16]